MNMYDEFTVLCTKEVDDTTKHMQTVGKYFHFPRFMWLFVVWKYDINSATRTIETHTYIHSLYKIINNELKIFP